ncbi:MAG TPA: PAS domain-containing protein [Gemmatimonadales bacterium]|nr:PAS domain-containing protein [Gemmatimonadales bacterium]
MPLDDPFRPDFGAVFESVPANYLLLSADFVIVGVSDAYLAATMTTRDTVVGRSLFHVFPDNPDDPAADGVRNLRASLERVLARRAPDRMPLQKYDIPRPGGGFEERWWSPLNTPILGPGGEVREILHWVEDVTELVRLRALVEREHRAGHPLTGGGPEGAGSFLRAEVVEATRLLRESERRYRFLSDAFPQLLWAAGPDGSIDWVNARWQEYTGLPPEAARGEGWTAALHSDERARVVAEWREAVRTGAERFQMEHRLRAGEDAWRWMLTTAVPYRDATGAIRTWLGITTDIHERVLAEEQLRQSQRLQSVGQLAGGMAHEVNNMMSVVMGYGELLLQQIGADDPMRRDIDEMVKAGARSAAITRQLLAFSRQQVLRPSVIDVGSVVGELTPTLQRVLGSDRRLEVVQASREARAVMDRTQLEQVLVNLVANARDATTGNGTVLIETRDLELAAGDLDRSEGAPGRYVRLTVHDDGAGMPPEVQARAFEPFFTTKPVDRGTGLGLSMVHGVVRQSGGFIRLTSAPGEGTSIAIHLPLVAEEITPVRARPAAGPGGGERILVVEDEAVVRSLVCRALEDAGYQVFQAPNGSAALDYVLANPGRIDLVLSDVVMPRLNGLELMARLRERSPRLPVLLMSGYSTDEVEGRGGIDPGVTILPKPITPVVLTAAVRESLDRAASQALGAAG